MKPIVTILLLVVNASICNSQSDRNIVLVNIDHLDREGIANELRIINSYNPAVIALDVQFSDSRHDEKDTQLINAIWECRNLVVASLIHNIGGKTFVSLAGHGGFFGPKTKTGFINTLLENDNKSTLKRFTVLERESSGDQTIEYHFAVRTAMSYDSIYVMKFINSHPNILDIDYKGGKRRFKKVGAEEVLSGKLTRKDVEGKIVIMSFLGPGDEDKFFTPLNKQSSKPDLYGAEYLANVVSQILDYRE